MILHRALLALALIYFSTTDGYAGSDRRAPAQLHAGRNDVEFDHQGRTRTAVIYLPTKAERPSGGWPLVLMPHGAGGSSKNVVESTGWADLGEREGFVTVFPNGTPKYEKRPASFLGHPQTWNSGGKESLSAGELSATAKDVDDVGFLANLIERVRKEVKINPKKIYVAGHSNGAGMAYRFGFERSDLVAAVGVVAGSFFLEPKPLAASVSLLQIVGDKDPFTPMEGGQVTIAGRKATMPPALQSPRTWASMLGLQPDPKTLQDDDKLTVLVWGPGKNGEEVKSIVIKGHGHAYPSPWDKFHPSFLFGPTVHSLNATETMWKFFNDHPKT